MQRKEKPLTNKERIEYWQMCRALIEMRGGRITKEEARRRFKMWADLPQGLSDMLFDSMRKQFIKDLSKGFPKSIPKYPNFRYIEEPKPRADKGKPRPHTAKKPQPGLPKTI